MFKLMILSSIVIANAALAHEVSFPLMTDLSKKNVELKCAEFGQTINKRLKSLLPATTSRMKVTEKKVYLTESDYTEYSCVALINNIPGEATIKYSVFSKSRAYAEECAEEVDLAKSQHPTYLVVADSLTTPLIGKPKCVVSVLDIVPTVLN